MAEPTLRTAGAVWVALVLVCWCGQGRAADAPSTFFIDFRNSSDYWYIAGDWDNPNYVACALNRRNALIESGVLRLLVTDEALFGKNYSCGEHQSQTKLHYGLFEIRLKVAKGSGLNTGFFIYTGPWYNDPWDEIDFEFLGKDTSKVQLNYWVDGVGGHEQLIDLGFDAAADFHTYSLVWLPESITWLVDGVTIRQVSASAERLPSRPGKAFVNLWVGQGRAMEQWLGPFRFDAPFEARVDWIRYTPH